jgi:hypothetical protein
VVFSDLFRQDLQTAVVRYTHISPRLGDDFNERVKAAVRTIIRWEGGDHIGLTGFPAAAANHSLTCSIISSIPEFCMCSVWCMNAGIPII